MKAYSLNYCLKTGVHYTKSQKGRNYFQRTKIVLASFFLLRLLPKLLDYKIMNKLCIVIFVILLFP